MWLLAAALAQPVPPDIDDEGMIDSLEPTRPKYGGIAIPLVAANSTDGLGLGFGGEFFRRPADGSDGFVWKLQVSNYLTTSLNYQSYFIGLETRAGKWQWLIAANHRVWKNMLYAGAGGPDVIQLHDSGPVEDGNRLVGPYFLVSVRRPFAFDDHLAVFAQSWTRIHTVDPGEGSLLAERAPVGSQGGVYSDFTMGLEYEKTDRWPLPYEGVRGEVDLRAGLGSFRGEEGLVPLVGAHLDVAGYAPAVPGRLVIGGRLLLARSSPKPFFEQDFTAGRRRDELGYEQPFTGYGRTRTRGDGAIAALVEVRPKIAETNHDFFDIELHLSAFVEEGFLLGPEGLGPHMPSMGGGPVLLWQGGTVLRPFASWGWRADAPDAARYPVMQFGVSLTDPL